MMRFVSEIQVVVSLIVHAHYSAKKFLHNSKQKLIIFNTFGRKYLPFKHNFEYTAFKASNFFKQQT